jgi:hypothetical protein
LRETAVYKQFRPPCGRLGRQGAGVASPSRLSDRAIFRDTHNRNLWLFNFCNLLIRRLFHFLFCTHARIEIRPAARQKSDCGRIGPGDFLGHAISSLRFERIIVAGAMKE